MTESSAHTASRALFAHVANRPEAELELDMAALLLGDWERVHTDIAHYAAQLDDWAERAMTHVNDSTAPGAIEAINRVLFTELGFVGNQSDYYDRRNNFLVEVMERRTGMPIALSVVYIEVARRIDLDIQGVGFPGHFMVRYQSAQGLQIIDPFRQGTTLDWSDLQALLRATVGDRMTLTAELLAATDKRHILIRMLTNLVGSYARTGDLHGAIEALERVRILASERPGIDKQLQRLYQQQQQRN